MQIRSERLIGDIGDRDAKKIIVCIGGIHGNESAGVIAIEQLIGKLFSHQKELSARFVGLRGNVEALARGVRFLDCDLNRIWTEDNSSNHGSHSETREKQELQEILSSLAAADEFSLIDLHTTSSESIPFLWDQQGNNILTSEAPLPAIGDFMVRIGGTLGSFFSKQGFPVLCAEGGGHLSEDSPRYLEDILWIALEAAGAIPHLAPVQDAHESLSLATAEVPLSLSIFHHHRIQQEDRFLMEPGFENFASLEAGTLIAHDKNGPITAPQACRLLLPLYQPQGEDGFLLARETGA